MRSVEKYSSHASGTFVEKLQPKVGLGGYDILFAYFVVEAKSKKKKSFKDEKMGIKDSSRGLPNQKGKAYH